MTGRPLGRSALRRIAGAVVAAEVSRLRPAGTAGLVSGPWPDATAIGDGGLGLDSLEQLGALGALAECFGLDEAGLGPNRPATVEQWVDWVERGRAADGPITVLTSGSTGTPQPCTHAIADLLDEAEFLARTLDGRRRVVALVPAHHLYGLIWTAILPDLLGVPVVSRTLGAGLHLEPGDLVVAVPEQWRAMLRLLRRLPDDVAGVSSGGPLPDDVAAGLRGAGLARLWDVYGSSETGAIALREWPAADHALLPRWTLADGEGLLDRSGRFFPLPDHVERTGPRSLRPAGRRDGAVQVGGHNVWPARVAAHLRALEGVADAAVRLGANGRLKAFVVPAPGSDAATLGPVLDRAVARLAEPERPKSFTFGAALPLNGMGKAADWG